jgi:trimethylamine--corrinoid protein Co-methyltransferase
VRPSVRFLDDPLIERILSEARDLLARLGVEIHNPEATALLCDHGATLHAGRVRIPASLVDRALATAPPAFNLHDVLGTETHAFGGGRTYFTPGSAAIHILDGDTGTMRKPNTRDYIRHVKLVEGLESIAAQSTAFIPADVVEPIQDSYRLFLSLLYGEKPVVTGAFTIESFEIMRDLQLIVRGSPAELAAKPLTIFSCCPTAPLKWSRVTSQNLLDCSRSGIPVELISMPLTGFMSPVTVVGSLVQHSAETLSGIVMGQLAAPGAPLLYGGSPAAFDVRYETTPMGAPETMLLDCGYAEIGRHLKLPTQAYTSLSDAKQLDAQAGLETSMGATLAVLSGIDNVSGPGMLDFESCQSLEKLLLDDEIAGMALRLGRGIVPRDDFPALPIFEELVKDGHLLISKHTRSHLRDEHLFPGPAIDRANRSRWLEEGGLTLVERARREVERRIPLARASRLPDSAKKEMARRMEAEARRHGMASLPAREP